MSPWESLKLGQNILTLRILTTDQHFRLINIKALGFT